jgi:hypothetical protein
MLRVRHQEAQEKRWNSVKEDANLILNSQKEGSCGQETTLAITECMKKQHNHRSEVREKKDHKNAVKASPWPSHIKKQLKDLKRMEEKGREILQIIKVADYGASFPASSVAPCSHPSQVSNLEP